MTTKLKFWKMHGAANDFILLDDRARTFPAQDREFIAALGARNRGVGSEGIILIQPATQAHFKMRFFNPDGGEVDMCGNGARCVARLAYDLGIAPAEMTFETGAGPVRAWILGDQVRIQISPPYDWRLNQSIRVNGETLTYHFLNTGVPHVVVPMPDIRPVDVARLGPMIRYHEDFAPKGTNVNFVQVEPPASLRVRTYERGVEAETPACGTGLLASALTMARAGEIKLPVMVHPASGDILTVAARLTADGAEDVSLTGPAVHVFTGEIERRS